MEQINMGTPSGLWSISLLAQGLWEVSLFELHTHMFCVFSTQESTLV